ncbi:18307_t:CDS:2 [Rhizophagus irregularis]|nr:18307_t:CDS:2 [Rhizophagus irregularis]
MGSYDYDTQRTNPAGVGHKNNHAATEVAETEEVKHLKSQYKNELTKLQEITTEWSEADLLFALQENQGDLEVTINRIMEGHISKWGEVKSRKSKKEHSSKNKQSGQQFGNAQRGHQKGGYSDRGRARGEGGRSGRNSDRTRGSRRENGGYTRPPRQQNGTNHDDTNNITHGKAWGTDNTSSSRNNNNDSNDNTSTWTTENVIGDWSTDITAQGGSWSAENPAENAKSSWASDSIDKAQSSRSKENPTDGWSGDNTQQSVKGVRTADATESNNISTDNNIATSRDIDKATDSLKHNRDSNVAKDNWDTEHPKDNWGVENDSWAADNPKDNWGSDDFGVDTTKNGKNVKEVSKSPNTVMKSVAPTKSPVSNSLRTIPPKPKASWAQIVKPESKPEPKPELLSTPIHKNPEIVKPVSPQISKSPNPVQSPQAPKLESAIALPQESLGTSSVITTKAEEMKEYAREVTSPEAPTATIVTSSTPVVNVSPRAKEVSPPGLKAKTSTATRRLKQDTPVVMPNTGAGLERVGVQFGSLSISNNNNVEESSETEPQIVPQVKTEERSSVSVETSPQPQTTPIQQQQQIIPQQSVQQLQQVSQQQVAQQATQQLQQPTTQLQQQLQPPQSSQPQSSTLSQSNSINRLPTTSAQALPSSVSSAPTGALANAPNQNFNPSNPSYFKQQQDQSSYLNQQHHLGLTEPISAPYASYLPNQPPNQLSGFGIGPIPEYNTMYGPDAQRIMGYYDPTYGQASPVTSTGYQAAYQQSGYGQPYVNKSIYPMYNHPTKPGSVSGASPYGYPTTPTTPNTPHHYSHTSNTGYEEVAAAQIHHHPDKTSVSAQSAGGVGQTGTQQHQQPNNPNYYELGFSYENEEYKRGE